MGLTLEGRRYITFTGINGLTADLGTAEPFDDPDHPGCRPELGRLPVRPCDVPPPPLQRPKPSPPPLLPTACSVVPVLCALSSLDSPTENPPNIHESSVSAEVEMVMGIAATLISTLRLCETGEQGRCRCQAMQVGRERNGPRSAKFVRRSDHEQRKTYALTVAKITVFVNCIVGA